MYVPVGIDGPVNGTKQIKTVHVEGGRVRERGQGRREAKEWERDLV